LIIIKFLKPNIFTNAINKMIGDFLKLNNVQPPSLSLDKIVKNNDNLDPILLVTSAGSDPSKEIEEYALKNKVKFE